MAKSVVQEFTKGLWTEIPPFRLVLGLCPTLAVTKGVETGIGMGIATTFVLVFSNIIISLLRSLIPKQVRIACFFVSSERKPFMPCDIAHSWKPTAFPNL